MQGEKVLLFHSNFALIRMLNTMLELGIENLVRRGVPGEKECYEVMKYRSDPKPSEVDCEVFVCDFDDDELEDLETSMRSLSL